MKDKNVAAILALFMGGIGVHKFYLGRIGAGVLYLLFSLTFIPAFLGVIDFFVLALMDKDEFDRRYNGANMLPPPVVVNMLPPHAGYAPYGMPPTNYGPQPYPGPHAPGMPPPIAPPAAASRNVDQLKAELEKLNELRISGLLTEEEFAQQKARLLGTGI
ncbi:MAG: NINE protein [Myxococcota bacterium]